MTTPVFRAPMRSRDDDVPAGIAIDRALETRSCGMGGRLDEAPDSLHDAVVGMNARYGERVARRLERFAAALTGAFVWTRDSYQFLWLGRIGGEWSYDTDPAAWAVDLVHVRPCSWVGSPIPHDQVPASVHATFARGGRNWQQIRDTDASTETERVWAGHAGEIDQVT